MGTPCFAGFSWYYQASNGWVGLVAFGVPIAVMTAALHLGAPILYLPEVSAGPHRRIHEHLARTEQLIGAAPRHRIPLVCMSLIRRAPARATPHLLEVTALICS